MGCLDYGDGDAIRWTAGEEAEVEDEDEAALSSS